MLSPDRSINDPPPSLLSFQLLQNMLLLLVNLFKDLPEYPRWLSHQKTMPVVDTQAEVDEYLNIPILVFTRQRQEANQCWPKVPSQWQLPILRPVWPHSGSSASRKIINAVALKATRNEVQTNGVHLPWRQDQLHIPSAAKAEMSQLSNQDKPRLKPLVIYL